MVVSTHDLNLAAALCTDLVLLRDGTRARRRADARRADPREHPRACTTSRPTSRFHDRRRPPDGGAAADGSRDECPLDAPRVSSPCSSSALAALAACLLAPLVGSTPISLRRVFDRVDSRSPTTSTRRSSSSPGCRARSPRRSSAARSRRRASCSRRCCATRSPRRSRSACPPARRSARCSRSPSRSRSPSPASPPSRSPASPARSARWRSSTRCPRSAGTGLSTSVLLLAGVTLNAFFSSLILFVQYLADFSQTFADGALADGRPRRRRATRRSSRRCRSCWLAFAVFAWLPRALNLLTLGADAAAARGVDVRPHAAPRVLQRVAGHRRGGVARRPGRLHRHHRAAPGAADGRGGPPAGAAGVGAVRRRVPGGVRRRSRAR